MSSFIDTDKTMQALQFSMDGLSKRVQAATNDVANADTPNYKASEVTFESSLRDALQGTGDNPLPLLRTDGAHIDPEAPIGQAAIVETPLLNAVMKNDNNNVDVDREMTTLAEANISYDAMAQFATTKMSILRSAISDTRP
ncbi:MAG TPA: flagellar basal body rod protein FlgB [Chloroflexota bacterium]|nr:flagellar basal body rod protein FlgB [Chloroflexota bacterium]